MKYFNIKRNKFSTILKNLNFGRYNFSKIYKIVDFKRYNFSKFYKYIDFRRLKLETVYRYLDVTRLDFFKKIRKIGFINFKYISIYIVAFVIFSGFVYLVIPTFYNYDKSKVEKIICKNKNIKCLIEGKINYRFYPTPRIKIKDLVINDLLEKKNTLLIAKNVAIKISIKNLLIKKKQNFKEIEFNDFNANIDLKSLTLQL